jgi:hypothetical protein
LAPKKQISFFPKFDHQWAEKKWPSIHAAPYISRLLFNATHLAMQFSTRLLKLIAWLATTLFTSMCTLLKRTHTRWEQHCQARWERDPRTAALRKELEESRDAAKVEVQQLQWSLAEFKAEVAFKLGCILAPCVNGGRPLYSPLYTMTCGCTVDVGEHMCMARGGKLYRGVYFREARLFSTVLTSLRQMEHWMSKQILTNTTPLRTTAPPARAVTLVDQGTDPMPPPPNATPLALPDVKRLLEDHCTDPVTLEVLESPVILGCGHAIGEQSLATWRRTASWCPWCRQTIRSQCRSVALQNTIAAIKELRDRLEQAKGE